MTRAAAIGARRHRITLLGETRQTGAGGRSVTSSSIIADVWAEAQEDAALDQHAGGQAMRRSARFILHFDKSYLDCRQVSWSGRRYRVTSVKATGMTTRQIEVAAVEISKSAQVQGENA